MKKKLLSLLFVTLLLLAINYTASYAACSASSKTVKSGEDFSITVTSSKGLEDYGLKLISYGGLTYKSCSGGSFANNGKISYAVVGTPVTTLGTYTFKAPNVTTDTTYKVTFNVETDTDETVTSTITVKAPVATPAPTPAPTPVPTPETTPEQTQNAEPTPATVAEKTPIATPVPTENETPVETKKSSNANLSNLGIKPNDFSGFKASNTSYSVSVPNDVSKIEVYATKAEDKQTISGTGSKNLSEGSNPFEITVTAEDGSTKTYKINVVRLAKEETNNPDVESPQEKVEVALASIQIVSCTLNEPFSPDKYNYTAKANADAKEVLISANANVEDAIIDLDAPEEFVDGENNIKLTVKAKDGSSKKEYTIKVIKEAEEVNEEEEEKENIIAAIGSTSSNDTTGTGSLPQANIIFCIGIGIITFLGIIFAVIRYIKDKRYAETEEDDEVDYDENIYVKNSIVDAANATGKLAEMNAEIPETGATGKRRGRHF